MKEILPSLSELTGSDVSTILKLFPTGTTLKSAPTTILPAESRMGWLIILTFVVPLLSNEYSAWSKTMSPVGTPAGKGGLPELAEKVKGKDAAYALNAIHDYIHNTTCRRYTQ